MADKPTPQDNHFEVVGGSEAPSNNTEAIHAGLNLGKARTNPHAESRHFVLIPDGTKLEYLERASAPVRRAGTVALNDEDSFLEYWKRQSGSDSYVYGSLTPAQFVAVINEQSREFADWRDHRATYVLKHSREWTVWTERNRKEFGGNKSFAEWLEDNLPDIVEPAAAKMMDIALNFRIKQSVGFANAVQLANGQIDLTYANIVEGSSEVRKEGEGIQKVQIPGSFTIEVPVWEGLNVAKYKVEARFRYRMEHGNSGGSLKLWYELVRPHKVIERSFKDMLDKIQAAIGQKVLFGTP